MARARILGSTTIAASSHAIKDSIGGIITLTGMAGSSGGSLLIETLTIHDQAQGMADMDVVLFNASPGGGGIVDDAAFDPTDAEILTIVAVIPVGGGNWSDFNDNSAANIAVNKAVKCAADANLYAVMVARSTVTTVANYPTLSFVVNQD